MFNERVAPSDPVFVICCLQGKGNKIPSDKDFLYEKFFELSKMFPELFSDYIFSGKDIYSHCRDMVDVVAERIIRNEMVVETQGGDCRILPSFVSRGKQVLKSFSTAEIIQISKAAKIFSAMIKKFYKNNKREEECQC
ncbi:MAG: hypothetical protein KGJ58_03145 [Patescibacteria group bacterium]|nr:hypothetical protein [Patescibacteria group bacterium]MDE1988748.1 hypothetical protein [Patescibacteria group bacterium]MDE2218421.1 hypothetical protein [Patescibacteria group bacterium]